MMDILDVSQKGVAYRRVYTLFVVVHRPVRSLMHEIVQQTQQLWGDPVHFDLVRLIVLALSLDRPVSRQSSIFMSDNW